MPPAPPSAHFAADAPCPVPTDKSLAALRMECGALEMIIANARADDLARPTRLPEWSVQQLLAHLVRGIERIDAYLTAPIPPTPQIDWLGYWHQVREVGDPAGIARRAREFADRVNDRPVLTVWRTTWTTAVEEAAACEPDRLLTSPFGPMRLDHYLTTRVFETTVHGLDLRVALGLEEVATPLGLEVTAAVLEGLLAAPRPVDLERDDIAFVLAATGRTDHLDPDLPVIT